MKSAMEAVSKMGASTLVVSFVGELENRAGRLLVQERDSMLRIVSPSGTFFCGSRHRSRRTLHVYLSAFKPAMSTLPRRLIPALWVDSRGTTYIRTSDVSLAAEVATHHLRDLEHYHSNMIGPRVDGLEVIATEDLSSGQPIQLRSTPGGIHASRKR